MFHFANFGFALLFVFGVLGGDFFSVLFFERATNMLELDVLKVKEGEKVLNIPKFVILSIKTRKYK